MRGKQNQNLKNHRTRRNIPAYAGKTAEMAAEPQSAAEHPRVCGENSRVRRSVVRIRGTSPRMRGKLLARQRRKRATRNIPAYAGKTLIDVRFLVPEGHFTFGFVFLHGGGSMESP